ncbi:MAG: PhnD/SsuA/transferrin family substrate-binding protein [Angelakisella sp.]
MQIKKILSLIMAVALLTMTACGGGAPSSSSAPAAPAETSAAPSSAPESSSMPEVSSGTVNQQPSCVMPAPPADGKRPELHIGILKGPSAIGMLQLMEYSDNPELSYTTYNDYTYTMAGSPDQLVGGVVKGEFDMAVLPTNLASTLYSKTEGKIKLATINTLGVLYLVEAGDSIKSVADLKGRTIYATGKGSTPEFVLNYVLEQNGLKVGTDVKVEYKTEHTELAALMAAGQADIALLPQPFVTTALSQNDKLRVALDMTKEWDTASKGQSGLAMSGIVVQQKLLEENPAAVEAFMVEYANSTLYVTEPQNLDAVAEMAVKRGIIPSAAVAKKAIPQCNIVFISGEEMKKIAGGFLQVLFEGAPQSVGGKLPDEGFYYTTKE